MEQVCGMARVSAHSMRIAATMMTLFYVFQKN